jgi:hypothetical protein
LVALVDDADYALVSQFRWHLERHVNGIVYARRVYYDNEGRRHAQKMHTLITGFRKTDHSDHDGLNNQRYNLRDGYGSLNQYNQRSSRGSSRFKGVSWLDSRHKWRAYIGQFGRQLYLGVFADEVAAARAYDAAARELFGGYACLNFPEEAA